jgi:hypothetical protein
VPEVRCEPALPSFPSPNVNHLWWRSLVPRYALAIRRCWPLLATRRCGRNFSLLWGWDLEGIAHSHPVLWRTKIGPSRTYTHTNLLTRISKKSITLTFWPVLMTSFSWLRMFSVTFRVVIFNLSLRQYYLHRYHNWTNGLWSDVKEVRTKHSLMRTTMAETVAVMYIRDYACMIRGFTEYV